MMVHQYYTYHSQLIETEGLEMLKGPQSFEDRKTLPLLHYYGSKGWYKWYRRTEFERQLEIMFQSEKKD